MIWRWKLVVLVVVLVPPVVAYLLRRDDPKRYQSSVLVTLSTAPGQTAPSQQNLLAVGRLVTTSKVAEVAAKLMGPTATPAALAGAVVASVDTDTGFITIAASDGDPRRAQRIAMAFGSALATYQRNVTVGNLNAQIAALKEQLASLPPTDPLRSEVLRQIADLRGQRGAQGPGATIVEAAGPGTEVGSGVRRDVEIALLIGVLLAIGVVMALESGDRRVRTPDDLEQITDNILLSAVPESAFKPQAGDASNEEAFHMLRAALEYFHIDRSIDVVVVTSPGQGDGKTTVATRLGLAAAKAGKRAVLIDADPRRPQVSVRLGIPPAAKGLSAVLAGGATAAEVMIDVPVEGQVTGRLMLLPAGPPPPNPSELLSSRRMEALLAQLAADSDLVVVDTPAALAVSDAVPLFALASGVILVARMNQSRRDEVLRLRHVIESAGGTLLGVVATGATGLGGYGGYGYGYRTYGDNRRRWRRPRSQPAPPAAPQPDEAVSGPVA